MQSSALRCQPHLQMRFQNSAGQMALHRRCGLDYDLKRPYSDSSCSNCSAGGRFRQKLLQSCIRSRYVTVCVMAVQAAAQVDEADEEAHERSIADITGIMMAQKNLNWKPEQLRFLSGGPEKVEAAAT